MIASSLPSVASSLAVWPGLTLVAGGLAKAVDVRTGDIGDTVPARLIEGRAPLRATWALVAAVELGVGLLVLAGVAVPWPEVAAALLLGGATGVAVWGLRNARDADCGCFGARATTTIGPRTAVRAGFLALLAALAAAGGASWAGALDDPAAVAAVAVSGLVLAWLSPELRAAVVAALGEAGPRARGLQAAACSRRVSVDRSVARLRRSELWRRARPYVSADVPTEHWDEGCWRVLCYPAVYEGEPVTAVFAVSLGLRQTRNRVAFVDEADRRVLGKLEAGRSPT